MLKFIIKPIVKSINSKLFATKLIKKRVNTIVNVCHQGEKIVVEQFGKQSHEVNSGLFLSIPFISKLYAVNQKELTQQILPQKGITKDNVEIEIAGLLQLKCNDNFKAMYGAEDPIQAAISQAQSVLRAAVGKIELDDLFSNRVRLSQEVQEKLAVSTGAWGLEILRYEITDVIPNHEIKKAMEKQANAERERRETVLRAEADKRSVELNSEANRIQQVNESEGMKIKLINEAEGNSQKIILEAEASKTRVVLEAEAKAIEIRTRAMAEAEGIIHIAKAAQNGENALNYRLAEKQYEALKELGLSKGTIIVPNNLSDLMSNIKVAEKIWNKKD